MDHVMYQMFKITVTEAATENITIRIYVNRIENRI